MRVDEIEQSGRVSLQAVLAGIDQADADRQIPLLRSAIDLALDRAAAAEHVYYDFLAECALLAAQNMQDVRLHDVERRLERLENPESPGLTEVVIETAIILGVELIVTLGVPWLAGPALLFVSSRLIAKSSRITAERASHLGSTRQVLRDKVASLKRDLNGANFDLTDAVRRIKAAKFASPYQPLSAEQILGDTVVAVRDAETALHLAGLELDKADKVVDAYNQALAMREARLKSDPLSDFLAGASGHTLKARLGESSGQQVAKLLADAAKQAGDSSGTLAESPFLSSTVVGGILSRLRELRLEAARGHGYTRLLLHQIDDADFAADAIAQHIARGAFDAIAPLESALALADIVRPVVVRGFEALLWYEWLSISGALRVDPSTTFDSAFPLEPGDLHNGYVTTRLVRQPEIQPGEFGPLGLLAALGTLVTDSGYEYEGDFYHGVRKLSEQQATYLYDTFAAPYFAVPENASLLPFRDEYDPGRYAEVLSIAPRNSAEVLTNFERARRLDEMRVMVVIFFTNFVASRRAKASYGVVSDMPILVDDYLSHLPAARPADPDEVAEPTSEQIAAQLNALFGRAGINARHEIGLKLTAFEGRLTFLEQKLWMYELVHAHLSYEAAEAPDGQTAADAAREIRDLQPLVEDEYRELSDSLNALNPEVVADFTKLYEERQTRLTGWQVGDPQPANYRFPK